MFKSMRRTRQELSQEECSRILKRGSSGVLAVCGEGEYPYAVPLSYAYLPGDAASVTPDQAPSSTEETKNRSDATQLGSIVFHCSQRGHKIEALRSNPRASFCVIDRDEPIPAELATHYVSVIAFGTVRFIDDDNEKRLLLTSLGAKYSPGLETDVQEEIDRFIKATCVIELPIEYLTGKQAKALADVDLS